MVNPEKNPFDEVSEAFDRFFVGTLKDTDYDLYKTSNGNYFCRNCTTKFKRSQNCPNCKKNIDWSKRIISIQLLILELVKGDKSAIACHAPTKVTTS